MHCVKSTKILKKLFDILENKIYNAARMVNEKDTSDNDIEVTNEDNRDDIELVDEEARSTDKIKQLREKLHQCDDEKKSILEESQRQKADFLNARKRLEDDRKRDKVRYAREYVETLLPLCDSFDMAMSDQAAWGKADATWRQGIEGIHKQLKSVLASHGVCEIDAQNAPFDPKHHDAIGSEVVADKKMHDTVVKVMQKGYELTIDGTTEIFRPARVIIGEYNE